MMKENNATILFLDENHEPRHHVDLYITDAINYYNDPPFLACTRGLAFIMLDSETEGERIKKNPHYIKPSSFDERSHYLGY